ncbi:hypothetical protein BGZ73_007348 [Actinomortierella ambigua]|nr:hypothetical protein BGZ73_007348 [Actinomortierella ambigua]
MTANNHAKYTKDVHDAIDAASQSLREVSLKLHSNPELGYKEVIAHETLTNYLESHGFKVTRHACEIDTAFIAEFESPATVAAERAGQKVHTIGFCSEYDALPDVGHACGHNLIAISGVAAAIGVKVALEKNNLPGRVRLLGTPAEETTGGKILMLQRGAFDGLAACMMLHPFQTDMVYATTLGVGGFLVEYHGKSSHASASPWEGVNALDAMVMTYNGLSMLRQQTIATSRIHCIILEGGKAANIIPDYASGKIMYRATNTKELAKVHNDCLRVIHASAAATGCTVTVHKEMEYQAMPQNEILATRYTQYLTAAGVKFLPRANQEAIPTGSTDMGNVANALPVIHPMFNIDNLDSVTNVDLTNHSYGFTEQAKTDVAHATTFRAAKGLALVGLDVVIEPGFAEAVRKDFEERVASVQPEAPMAVDGVAEARTFSGHCGCQFK